MYGWCRRAGSRADRSPFFSPAPAVAPPSLGAKERLVDQGDQQGCQSGGHHEQQDPQEAPAPVDPCDADDGGGNEYDHADDGVAH